MERQEEILTPTIEDLEKSRLYFSELEDALKHYSSLFPPGRFKTMTWRSDPEGIPRIEMVSDTRFPPLDDLPDHLRNLQYVAKELDNYPPTFWNQFQPRRLKGEHLPYVSMQIIAWGKSNQDQGVFKMLAELYSGLLGNFSWSESDHPDTSRDHAEQSFRIIDAYLKVKNLGKVY